MSYFNPSYKKNNQSQNSDFNNACDEADTGAKERQRFHRSLNEQTV